MISKEIPEEPTIKICLLDFTYDNLQKILSDDQVASDLVEYNESGALAHIDELLNLHEAPVTAYFLNNAPIIESRNQWTVEIPVSVYEKILPFCS